ncbi:hypothetical protein JL722_14655 [Aureococcus anophagefferens]|nr:hypothetical protein JL722_14655 [Aureococcus anophagefferens]
MAATPVDEDLAKALIDPIYGERSKIVRGELEPALSEEDRATVEQAGTTTDEADGPIVGVPDFWLSALGRNEAFEHFLEEPDVAALKYLVDVRCADFEDLTGFTPELEKITGCEIAWKDAKDNLCVHELEDKPSFFHFFKSIKLPSADDDDEDEGDGEQFDERCRDKIDNHAELAFALEPDRATPPVPRSRTGTQESS